MIVTKPICIPGNVTQALGTNNADVGAVCTSPNINIWARKKPVRLADVPGEITEAQRKSVNYGLRLDAFFQVELSQVTIGPYLHFREAYPPQDPDQPVWVNYDKPRGKATYNEWYRLLDFDGYDTEAKLPLRLLKFDNNPKTYGNKAYAVAYFEDNGSESTMLNYTDLQAKDGSRTYDMSQMYIGVALFVLPTPTSRWYVCIKLSMGHLLGLGGGVGDTIKLQNLPTVTQAMVEASGFPSAMVGKKYMLYEVDSTSIPGMLEDVNDTPVKTAELYMRPLLSYTDEPGITFSGGVSNVSFLPLRTPSDITNNIKYSLYNQIYIYCDVTSELLDVSGANFRYRFRPNLRIANCYPYDSSGHQKFFTIYQLQVRMYPTYEDYQADPCNTYSWEGYEYRCDVSLTDILDRRIDPPDPMWNLGPVGLNTSGWHNDFGHYSRDDVYYDKVTETRESPYKYFRVLLISEGEEKGWEARDWQGVTPEIVIQNGMFGDGKITDITPEPEEQ